MVPLRWQRVAPWLSAVLFGISILVLGREVRAVGFPAFADSLKAIPRAAVLQVILLTALNYIVLTWHDRLAFQYAGVRLTRARIGLASFVGYAISNNVGFAMMSGTSARCRFYARWGLTAGDISRVVLFYSVTFWLGLCLVGGVGLICAPPAGLQAILPGPIPQATGTVALLVVASYMAVCLLKRQPLRVGQVTLPLPRPTLLLGQIAVSSVDWALMAAIFYTLLPAPRPGFFMVAGAVTAAQLVGLISHVPGGVGVFEGLVVLLLRLNASTGSLVSALIAFRLVYYILPLAIALAVLLIDEARQRRTHLTRWSRTCRALAGWAAPPMMAFFTFAAGMVLLFSSATPAVPERLAWIARVVPLPLLELSHFTASLTGLLLLLLAQGIAARIDAAYDVTAGALAVGSVASLLKGGDYEEAGLLLLMLVALVGGRRHFTRRARAFDRPLSTGWLAAVVTAVAAAMWLGFFVYQHVAYTNALWWQFAFNAEAPRFLRAAVAVTICALLISVRRLFRPALPRRSGLADADLSDIDGVIAGQTRATAYLVYLGDKSILWNSDRTAFLMYATRGKSAVYSGDPVGPPTSAPELIRAFLQLADRFALTPVFYEVSRAHMSDYADSGLISLKIGEEARVALHTFSLSGGTHKALRASLNRIAREGFTFRIVDAPLVPSLLDELGDASDEWVTAKNAAEKGFSLGYFSEPYLVRFPVALIERDGRIEAFANLWLGSRNVEVSVDLMRYRSSAPSGVMDALFAHTMLWARERGYRWFNLGMAPLAGLSVAPSTHTWSRLAHFVYRHGEAFYNFQGLRAYKAKFNPVWEPRYIVYPGGLSLPRVLADVTALVGGGYVRMLRRAGRRAA